MWFSVALVVITIALTVGILACAGVLKMAPEANDGLRKQAARGDAFLIEPIVADTFMRCGCLTGMPASYKVSGGSGANGLLCVVCVRLEVSRWLYIELTALRRTGSRPSPANRVEGSCEPVSFAVR